MRNVVAVEAEVVVCPQCLDVRQIARDQVVHADDFMPIRQESLAQVRADKTRTTGDYRPHDVSFCPCPACLLWSSRAVSVSCNVLFAGRWAAPAIHLPLFP